jgi:hypothetical protein
MLCTVVGAGGYTKMINAVSSLNGVHTRWLAGLMNRPLVTLRENGGGRFVLSTGVGEGAELSSVPVVWARLGFASAMVTPGLEP